MKLLTIAYNYPPIRGPEAIQAAHLIRGLEKQNIECDVVTRFVGSGRKFSNRVEVGGNVLFVGLLCHQRFHARGRNRTESGCGDSLETFRNEEGIGVSASRRI